MVQRTKNKASGPSIQAEVLAVRRTLEALSAPVSELFTELSTLASQVAMLNDDIPLADESCFGALATEYDVTDYGQNALPDGEKKPVQNAGPGQVPARSPASESNRGRAKRGGRQVRQGAESENARAASSASKSGIRESYASTASGADGGIAQQSESVKNSRPSSQDRFPVEGATEDFKPVFALSSPRTSSSGAIKDDMSARGFKSVDPVSADRPGSSDRSDVSAPTTAHRSAEMKSGERKGVSTKYRPVAPQTVSVSAQRGLNKRQRGTASIDAMERIAYLAESLLKPPSATQTEKQRQVSRASRTVPTLVTRPVQAPVIRESRLHTAANNTNETSYAQLQPEPLNQVALQGGQQVISTTELTAATPLVAPQTSLDSNMLAELVNETLVEQARRNGVDLS